jgi:HSP20 family molecular chaperone IbpA
MSTTKEMVQTQNATDKPQRLSELPTVTPPVDIFENEDEILLVADFPGVDPEQVEVRLEGGQIDIEGRQAPPEEQARSLPSVMFARSFRVPETVNPEGVSAELKAGVLRVHLKKSEAAKPRRIKVNVG